MKNKIIINSPIYTCFHEAGHAELALRMGARVLKIELKTDNTRNYGYTKVQKSKEDSIRQSRLIALGGFAAEYFLYQSNCLIKEDGKSLTEKEFIDYAYANAEVDLHSFWGTDNPSLIGKTHLEMEQIFMNFAIDQAKNHMNMDMVERIAEELLSRGILSEDDVNAVILEPKI